MSPSTVTGGPTNVPFQNLYTLTLVQPLDNVGDLPQYLDSENATLVVELGLLQILKPILVSCSASFTVSYNSESASGTIYVVYTIYYNSAALYSKIVDQELTAVSNGDLQVATRFYAGKYFPSLTSVIINRPPVFVSLPPGTSLAPASSSSTGRSNNKLSTGALVGIIVGCVLGALLLIVCVLYYRAVARNAKNINQQFDLQDDRGTFGAFFRNTFVRSTWASQAAVKRPVSARLQMSTVRTSNVDKDTQVIDKYQSTNKRYLNPDELYEDLFVEEGSKSTSVLRSQPNPDKKYTNPDELYEDLFGVDADRALSIVQQHVVSASERRSLRMYNSDTKNSLGSDVGNEFAAALAENPMTESEFADLEVKRDSAEFSLVADHDSRKLVFFNKSRNPSVIRLDEEAEDSIDQGQLPEPQDFHRSSVFASYTDENETRRASIDPDANQY